MQHISYEQSKTPRSSSHLSSSLPAVRSPATFSLGPSLRKLCFLLLTALFTFAQDSTKPLHFEIPQADVSTRYRYIDNNAGMVTSDDLQYRFIGRFRLDVRRTGTYFGSRVETGSSFGSGWSNTGIGRSESEWTLNAKTFFIGQRLTEHVVVEVGAMDFEQGAGSEATYADFDAYTEGYRLKLSKLSGRFSPSRVTVTFGYVGDFNTVNSFARLHRLGEINYAQFLAEKKFNKTVVASAEFDRLRGINLFRTATKLTLPTTWLVNDAQLETVVRMNDGATAGYAIQIVKSKNRFGRINPGIYYSHLPAGVYQVGTQQALINGDVYGTGKRIGFTTRYQFTKSFDISTLVTRKLDSDPGFRWRAQIVARYQLAPLLKFW
jgi:hypothetical protein